MWAISASENNMQTYGMSKILPGTGASSYLCLYHLTCRRHSGFYFLSLLFQSSKKTLKLNNWSKAVRETRQALTQQRITRQSDNIVSYNKKMKMNEISLHLFCTAANISSLCRGLHFQKIGAVNYFAEDIHAASTGTCLSTQPLVIKVIMKRHTNRALCRS